MPGAVFAAGEQVTLRTREREDATFRRDHVNHPDLRRLVGTKLPQNEAYGSGEVGLWIVPDAQGRGYGSEALELLVSHAFDQLRLHRVTAEGVLATNDASRHTLEGLGFTEEGRHRDAAFVDGAYRDTHTYAVLESEWRERTGGG